MIDMILRKELGESSSDDSDDDSSDEEDLVLETSMLPGVVVDVYGDGNLDIAFLDEPKKTYDINPDEQTVELVTNVDGINETAVSAAASSPSSATSSSSLPMSTPVTDDGKRKAPHNFAEPYAKRNRGAV